MQKVLNQEEIDAMVRATRAAADAPASSATQPQVESWDVGRAGQIGREQLQAITLLHEGFARNLTNSLGAYLRVVFASALVSAEHLTYREFLQRVPETTYLAACRLDPMGVRGLLQLDLKVAFPIIDLLLGGEGKAVNALREITEIERQILESVSSIICRELETAWQALGLEVSFDGRLETAEAPKLMPPEEKTLSLSFEVTMAEVRGGLNLAVPAAVSNALLRKISAGSAYRRPRGQADSRRRLMHRLQDCRFDVELGACNLRVPISQLAGLAPGGMIRFVRGVDQPASLLIAGVEIFRAQPALCAGIRAARVLEPWPAGQKEKENRTT